MVNLFEIMSNSTLYRSLYTRKNAVFRMVGYSLGDLQSGAFFRTVGAIDCAEYDDCRSLP
jgi:hypothetical protein